MVAPCTEIRAVEHFTRETAAALACLAAARARVLALAVKAVVAVPKPQAAWAATPPTMTGWKRGMAAGMMVVMGGAQYMDALHLPMEALFLFWVVLALGAAAILLIQAARVVARGGVAASGEAGAGNMGEAVRGPAVPLGLVQQGVVALLLSIHPQVPRC